jgi:RES domain-containing protein
MSLDRVRFAGRTHRLIASCYPTVGVFDDIAADEDEVRTAFLLESLSSSRLQTRLAALPAGGVATGPTASLVMAAFLHCSVSGGRFTDHRLGAWYACTEIETAIEETVHHHERRLRLSDAGFPARIQMRELIADLDLDLLDVRKAQGGPAEIYDPEDYGPSQAFAASRRWPFAEQSEDGLVFDSVRRAGGTNVCVFRPAAVTLPIIQGAHYEYVWDARGEPAVLLLTSVARG